MTNYLLDTNILLRASDPNSPSYSLARDAIYQLLDQGHKGCLTPQNLIEFWVVATRPTDVNGFGWTPERTIAQINQFLPRFLFLEEKPEIFTNWLQLMTNYKIKGKRSHDIRDDPFTAKVLEIGRKGRLKVLAKWGIGVDAIDLKAAKELGIFTSNTPDVFGDEVADVALGYVILLARQLQKMDAAVRQGNWLKIRGTSLRGKVAGIIGVGSIGKAIAARIQ